MIIAEINTIEGDKLLHTLQTVGHLSNKAARRVYTNIVSHLNATKKNGLLRSYVSGLIEFLRLTQYLHKVNETASHMNGEEKKESQEEKNAEEKKNEWRKAPAYVSNFLHVRLLEARKLTSFVPLPENEYRTFRISYLFSVITHCSQAEDQAAICRKCKFNRDTKDNQHRWLLIRAYNSVFLTAHSKRMIMCNNNERINARYM